jgi:hypothetical protein
MPRYLIIVTFSRAACISPALTRCFSRHFGCISLGVHELTLVLATNFPGQLAAQLAGSSSEQNFGELLSGQLADDAFHLQCEERSQNFAGVQASSFNEVVDGLRFFGTQQRVKFLF